MLGQIRFGPRLDLHNRTDSALSITTHDKKEVKLLEKWTRKDDEPDYNDFVFFDLARLYAPTDNEETHVGTFHKGCIADKDELVQLTKTQLKHVVALKRQLSLSKSDLMCFIMDCYATVQSADQIMRRANEWFGVMLDDLEKRILGENVLIRRHRENIDEMLAPILKKLVDLRMFYKAIAFLDERLLIYNKTIQCSQQNRESARRSLQKLVAYDKEQQEEFTAPGILELTGEVSSAFCQLEGILVKLFPFIVNSPQLNALLETILGQMRSVLRALAKKDCMDTSSVHIPSTESVASGVPNLNGDLNKLFAAPQRRKHCSYLKLDEWPSEETRLNSVADDTVSSSVILSAKFPTEPLSDFHQSDRSGSSTNSSLFAPGGKNTPSKSKGLISFHSANSITSCDRPPTFVGSRGPSEVSPCSSFEEANLIRKKQLETEYNVSAESSTSTARQQTSSSGCVLKTSDTRKAAKKSGTDRKTKKKPKPSKSLPRRKISKSGTITSA
uniref:Uncharacterized protein n=1 Tax=Angiostrongylus cantonensis TaxID=6313 RepID=A0A158P9H3_ANGCA